MSNSPENLGNERESGFEVSKNAAEQLEKLSNKAEKSVELSPRDAENQAERIRAKALEMAISVEAGGKENKKSEKTSASPRRGRISKKQLNESYKRTMKQVQDELPAGSRVFSKVIHAKPVEKSSEFIGNTLARPNAILAGSVVAFVLTLLTYITAKTVGYSLSGFETIAAFIIGWTIGVIYDYFHALITGKKL